MAIKSMTGFGEGKASAGGVRVSVEIGSVNRKQLDVNVTLPRNLITLDARVQSRVRQEITRGRITGIVRLEMADGDSGRVMINASLATQYVREMRALAKKLGVPDDLGAEALTRLPGLVSVEQEDLDAGRVAGVLDEALNRALTNLTRMRRAEGRALASDLRDRLTQLEEQLKAIRKHAGSITAHHREKLLQRLKEAGFDNLCEDERVVKEIALFTDRSDISEELTRIRSHLTQVRLLLRSTEPAGRPLDFLCQELLREINTVGSKAGGVEITREVVGFKSELERIREQVQNIE